MYYKTNLTKTSISTQLTLTPREGYMAETYIPGITVSEFFKSRLNRYKIKLLKRMGIVNISN